MRPARSFLWFAGLTAACAVLASEGKWTPEQMLQLDPAWLKKQGLKLSPKQLWDPKAGTGLLAAAVEITGCSAAFVSDTGLIVTNHHCLFGILQQHSSPQRDLITQGFLARTREEELPGRADRVFVPRRFTDVTREVLAAVPPGADDVARFKAIERKQKELVLACQSSPELRCDVESFDDGHRFVQVETVMLQDVRLVYAPPLGVGEYGGEIDNWSWPRHTGDFAIGRAYVAPDGSPRAYDAKNVPYRPKFKLPLSQEGVGPGDFVAVLGYPGKTYRSLIAEEMQERRDVFFPWIEKHYGEWIAILEQLSKEDDATRIAVASTLKSMHNRYKNAQGQLAGFKRGAIVEKQQAADAAVVAFAKKDPKWKDALAAREGLAALVSTKLTTWERDMLLSGFRASFSSPSKALWLAMQVVRLAQERPKADLERDPELMEREWPRLRERMEREQKTVAPAAERRMLRWYVDRSRTLSPQSRIEAFDAAFKGLEGAALDQRIAALLGGTRVLDAAERKKMLDESTEQLRARKDPMLELAFALSADFDRMQEVDHRYRGGAYRLRPRWRDAVIAQAGRPVAPDANSTLRISLAHVMGYAPRDGVFYTPQTTLSGFVAKHTGEEPFDAPKKVLDAAAKAKGSRWQDRKLGDVPVAFLADGDTTGGNSGSPVIDGRGRLVGVNFDRVWENVANDFGFNPDIARNISADVRFLLWNLDEVEHADALLGELGVTPAKKK